MAADKESLEKKLSDQVFQMEDEEIAGTAEDYVEAGYPAADAIRSGLVEGMTRAGEMFEKEEYYVTELLLCSDAMYRGLEVLEPHLPREEKEKKTKVVIGVVEGDMHDIGKNLVKTMLEAAGFEVIDLGQDVPAQRFADAIKETNAPLLCLSTLMSTTMPAMREVIERLEAEGIRDRVRVMVGGSPVSQRFADQIGADGYSGDAVGAVELAKRLTGETAET